MTPYKGWTVPQINDVKNNKIADGKTYNQCVYFARAHLHKSFQPVNSKVVESRNLRGKKFYEMHERGMSYSQISLEVGLTRQRIHAIIQSYLKSIKVDV